MGKPKYMLQKKPFWLFFFFSQTKWTYSDSKGKKDQALFFTEVKNSICHELPGCWNSGCPQHSTAGNQAPNAGSVENSPDHFCPPQQQRWGALLMANSCWTLPGVHNERRALSPCLHGQPAMGDTALLCSALGPATAHTKQTHLSSIWNNIFLFHINCETFRSLVNG